MSPSRIRVLDFLLVINLVDRHSYPHLTTLVLNAGIGAFTGLDWAGAMRQFITDPVGTVLDPHYIMQEIGRKSGDGLRGGVWGVNVLSMYILVSEIVVSATSLMGVHTLSLTLL